MVYNRYLYTKKNAYKKVVTIALETIKNYTLFPIVARFPEAEKRLLDKKICMKCGARNAPRATRCRRCRSKSLRPKAKEGRGV